MSAYRPDSLVQEQCNISKIKLLRILKTRLDLECSGPALNKHTICKSFTLRRQNRHIISCTWFMPLVFLQRSCLLNAGLKHSRSDLVFKQPGLRNNFVFRMLCWMFTEATPVSNMVGSEPHSKIGQTYCL